MIVTFEFNCPKCGENRFKYPARTDQTTPILCESCGESMGNFADLEKRVGERLDEFRRRRLD